MPVGLTWLKSRLAVCAVNDRRIPTRELLESEIAAWERQRNASGDRIKWMFTTEKARTKMGHADRK